MNPRLSAYQAGVVAIIPQSSTEIPANITIEILEKVYAVINRVFSREILMEFMNEVGHVEQSCEISDDFGRSS